MSTEVLWTELNGGFCTEISDLQASDQYPFFACPKCKEEVAAEQLKPVVSDGNEITQWIGRCLCDARLTIFND